ncbi:DUF3016 domain-containing protein [Paraferrimonas haliotis]|uniref:DUF3016 domain-containing protein n=1 Tax=Paraferrimonas haliotis TaxID=2013866 RepID=A0AA37TT58_9GAMM|nr:DUF3016 domain-containing protein [Paraferrimonas haliotis]GLS82405.1 hypothetical protein GCM10007894_03820 [Paraferrimonas haliotis]
MKLVTWLTAAAMMSLTFTTSASELTEPNYVVEETPVMVTWENHKDYRDVKAANDIQSRYAKRAFDQITEELAKDAGRVLAEGQTLTLVVTELDLAGDVRPTFGAGPSNLRIIEGIYPPRIHFSYEVKQDGKVVVQGNEEIRDMGFDTKMRTAQANHKSFYFESRMMKDWLNKKLKPQLSQ